MKLIPRKIFDIASMIKKGMTLDQVEDELEADVTQVRIDAQEESLQEKVELFK